MILSFAPQNRSLRLSTLKDQLGPYRRAEDLSRYGKPGCPNDHRNQVLARDDEVIRMSATSGYDAVDGSSTGTRVPRSGRRLRLPRFGGAVYAVNFDNWSGYREVGLSSARR